MRVLMMGTGSFAEPTFRALVDSKHEVVGLVTQPDRAVGQERGSTRLHGRGMKELAIEKRLPVHQPESINTSDGVAYLKASGAEILVVAAYGQILSRDVLAAIPRGGINVHASLLPKYRGAAPIAWAIFHGESETGVSIIRMSVQLDGGDILAQESLPIGPDESAGELETRLAPVGARLAMATLDALERGPVVGKKQDLTLVTKAPKLKKEDGAILWQASARQVCNQIRAMQPWPTPYTYWLKKGGEPLRLILNKAAAHEMVEAAAEPGVVLARPGLWVAAGNGTAVEILELQPAGKRRMAAADFLRGNPIEAGDRLGRLAE